MNGNNSFERCVDGMKQNLEIIKELEGTIGDLRSTIPSKPRGTESLCEASTSASDQAPVPTG